MWHLYSYKGLHVSDELQTTPPPNMTCGGKKSPEIKDSLVLITTFAGTQANA